jgi:ribonuclease T2
LQTNPISVERAFADANPGLRADMIQISCRRDTLTEVRLCIGRDLKSFVTCPAIQRSDCRARDISIPAGR